MVSFQLLQAGFVFTFIYLAGVLGERVQYDLRKMLFNHSAGPLAFLLCPERGGTPDRTCHIRYWSRL